MKMRKFLCRLQLEFAVAVDFTASNGPIHSRQSLHYVGADLPNQYEMAISAVLQICEHYNHTKNFEATGFGAKIPPHGEVSHLFPLVRFSDFLLLVLIGRLKKQHIA